MRGGINKLYQLKLSFLIFYLYSIGILLVFYWYSIGKILQFSLNTLCMPIYYTKI
jgi:hypothetical protein